MQIKIAQVKPKPKTIFRTTNKFSAGKHVIPWRPLPNIHPRTYVVRLSVWDVSGKRFRYGFKRTRVGERPKTPVIRVQGVDAFFAQESYAPGSKARLTVATDAQGFDIQIFRSGAELITTTRNDEMNGIEVTTPVTINWTSKRNAPHGITVGIGSDWLSGLYYAKLTSSDSRVGYAPFIVRPRSLGENKVAVVLPTFTWQAYNHYDENGDGWGDTWYARWKDLRVRLGRPHLERGVPMNFRRYDLPFLRWLAQRNLEVDYLSDSDLGAVANGDVLASAYKLIIFPGHHEYVTTREFNNIERYRKRGGNLMFLSANNFFWRVIEHGKVLTKTQQWRDLGRPEAALIGVQYKANDRGENRGPYVVRDINAAPWLFEGTGLVNGSEFGNFGIEIDALAPSSPSDTKVLAEIPDLFGPGYTAQMTYYEKNGSKVFAAGAFTLAGLAATRPVNKILENLWRHMTGIPVTPYP